MANYISTSCTDAYIKINNTYSLPAKCGHHIAPASRVVWLKTLYLCIVIDLFSLFLILLSTKKVCGRNHKAKLTSQSSPAAHSDKIHWKRKVHCTTITVLGSSLQLFIRQQWGKNIPHIVKTSPCYASTLKTVLDSSRCVDRAKKFDRAQTGPWPGATWMEMGAVESTLSVSLTWKDDWHFSTD